MVLLPIVSGDRIRKALERLGWQFKHQTGSHMIMDKPGQEFTISVPRHKEVKKGLLKRIINLSGAGEEEFLKALRK